MNEEKKHFNAIDVLIIIGIILIVLALIFRAQIIALFDDRGDRTECKITVIADEVPKNAADSLAVGDEITWLDNSVSIGSIEAIEKAPSKVYVEGLYGSYTAVDSDSLCTVTLTVSTTCLYDKGCYIDGKHFIAKGMELLLSNKTAQFSVTVVAVEY